MTILAIVGFESDSASEVASVSGTSSLVTSPVSSGAYALKISAGGTGTIQMVSVATGGPYYTKTKFYIATADVPSSLAAIDLMTVTLGGTVTNVSIKVKVVSSAVTIASNAVGVAGADQAITTNAWHEIECKWHPGATVFEWKLDGVLIETVTVTYAAATISQFRFNGPNTLAVQWDDIVVRDDAYHGSSHIIARQTVTGGAAPTYDAWTKSTGTDAGALWDNTPFTATDSCNSGSVLTSIAQTAVNTAFNVTQTGHGSETVASGDTINACRLALVGKTSSTTQSGSNFSFRRRAASADTDAASTALTASDSYIAGPIFTETFANLNAIQIGILKAATGQARTQTVEDMWLMADYTVASAGTWKTAIGLATASVKTVNGLAIASIKTFNGLTP